MEIPDESGLMVQVPDGGSKVADEGSMLNLPLPEEFRSSPCNVVSGHASDACFPDDSNLEINQMSETNDKLHAKLHKVAVRGNLSTKW